MQTGRWAKTIIVILLLLAVAVVYAQSVTFGFINLDDASYVEHNRHVAGGLTAANVVWAFTQRYSANWHPVTWLSHMLDCQLFGLHPAAHHAVNNLLHAINAALLLILLARLTGRFWPAAMTAALFALHPLRVESVAWVAERKDVLSGFFFMLTLLAYERYARRRLPGMFSVVAVLFALGLMSKPMLVTLPAILLLLDYWPLDRVRYATSVAAEAGDSSSSQSGPQRDTFLLLVVEKLPLFCLAAASCVVTMWAQRTALDLNAKVSLVSRFQTAFSAYLIYLTQAFWPVDLSPFYPFNQTPLTTGRIFAAIAVVVAVGIAALVLSKKCPYLATGWLWFLGMLIPVIGIVPVGGQSHADRYTYLPLIGVYWAISFAAADVVRRRSNAVGGLAAVAASLVLALFAAGAWRQAAYWRTPEILWRRSLAIDGENHLAHSQLGDLFMNRKNFAMAKVEFEHALKTGPKNLIARMGLGAVLAEQNQLDEAEKQFRQVIEDSPHLPNGYTNLGELLSKKHQYAAAIACFEKALELQPDDDATHVGIAVALRNVNRLDEAMRHELIALALNPQSVDAHRNLANLLASTGHRQEATVHYRKALQLAPGDVAAATYLAWILATTPPAQGGDPSEALRLIEPIAKQGNGSCEQLDTLAAAYAGVQRFTEAQETAARAKELALSGRDKPLADDIGGREKLYREHKPYVEQ